MLQPAQVHSCWLHTAREEGGLGGRLPFPLWSDPAGSLASQFDLYSEEDGECLAGLVVVDGSGQVRHAMTTSLDCSDTAKNAVELVRLLQVSVSYLH